jgi:hypothetical protein
VRGSLWPPFLLCQSLRQLAPSMHRQMLPRVRPAMRPPEDRGSCAGGCALLLQEAPLLTVLQWPGHCAREGRQ